MDVFTGTAFTTFAFECTSEAAFEVFGSGSIAQASGGACRVDTCICIFPYSYRCVHTICVKLSNLLLLFIQNKFVVQSFSALLICGFCGIGTRVYGYMKCRAHRTKVLRIIG